MAGELSLLPRATWGGRLGRNIRGWPWHPGEWPQQRGSPEEGALVSESVPVPTAGRGRCSPPSASNAIWQKQS